MFPCVRAFAAKAAGAADARQRDSPINLPSSEKIFTWLCASLR